MPMKIQGNCAGRKRAKECGTRSDFRDTTPNLRTTWYKLLYLYVPSPVLLAQRLRVDVDVCLVDRDP